MSNKANKKGISEVVAYALLILIAIGLAAGVYSFLKVYVPKEKAECPTDVSISLQNYDCRLSEGLKINVTNTGFFKIDGIYVWLANPTAKKQVHDSNTLLFIPPLYPGEQSEKFYRIQTFKTEGEYEIIIEPVIIKNNIPVACANSIIKQAITCTAS
ncbi:MAG: archaellin/type IV pilin N-terminal domain-containing protein [Candidatus Pacearchaeota archaeon]